MAPAGAGRAGRLSAVVDAAPKAQQGRREVRVLWALADPEQIAYAGSSGTPGTAWPHLRQVGRVDRHRRTVRHGQVVAGEVEVRH